MNETRTNTNMVTQSNVVAALFRDRDALSNAIDELTLAGFENKQINTYTVDDLEKFEGENQPVRTTVREAKADDEDKPTITPDASSVTEDVTRGAVTGAVVGGVAGLGVGAATGAAVPATTSGVAVGGLIGAFAGLGLTDRDREFFEGDLRKGWVLVTVNAGERRIEAKQILENHGGRTSSPVDPTDSGSNA